MIILIYCNLVCGTSISTSCGGCVLELACRSSEKIAPAQPAWRQPHVESGAGFSKLTSCDAVAPSRQVCACVIFSEERWASSRTMPPLEVDDSVVRSGGMVTRRPSDKVVLAFVIPHRRRQECGDDGERDEDLAGKRKQHCTADLMPPRRSQRRDADTNVMPAGKWHD